MIKPQRFGTTVQSSCRFGLMPTRLPIALDSATIAPAAGKSSGAWARSAISTIHPRMLSGRRRSLNAGTLGRPAGGGGGSGHVVGLLIMLELRLSQGDAARRRGSSSGIARSKMSGLISSMTANLLSARYDFLVD